MPTFVKTFSIREDLLFGQQFNEKKKLSLHDRFFVDPV